MPHTAQHQLTVNGNDEIEVLVVNRLKRAVIVVNGAFRQGWRNWFVEFHND